MNREPVKSTESSKQIVCLLSTMRSGSTLLKALMAEAPDISSLPEVNFQRYARLQHARRAIELLDPRRIILLKRPAWYNESRSYPKLPVLDNLKLIVLVRDVYDTVESCRKMTFRPLEKTVRRIADPWLAKSYWLPVTAHLLRIHDDPGCETCLVRYEDLLADPIDVTRNLFAFLGSEQTEGVATYRPPDDSAWRWGIDDNSPQIRSRQVQRPRFKRRHNRRLLNLVQTDPAIGRIRAQAGYADTDPT